MRLYWHLKHLKNDDQHKKIIEIDPIPMILHVFLQFIFCEKPDLQNEFGLHDSKGRHLMPHADSESGPHFKHANI